MTKVYLVRHAQPDFDWEDDRTRPLTAEGMSDRQIVLEAAAPLHKEIVIDERLRELEKGENGNTHGTALRHHIGFL